MWWLWKCFLNDEVESLRRIMVELKIKNLGSRLGLTIEMLDSLKKTLVWRQRGRIHTFIFSEFVRRSDFSDRVWFLTFYSNLVRLWSEFAQKVIIVVLFSCQAIYRILLLNKKWLSFQINRFCKVICQDLVFNPSINAHDIR